MQQLCSIAYLSFVLLPQLMDVSSISAFKDSNSYRDDSLKTLNLHTVYFRTIFGSLYRFATCFFYYEYYLSSLMLTLDIYVMVCEPFRYGEFSAGTNIAKCLLVGSLVSFLIASSDLVSAFVSMTYYFLKPTSPKIFKRILLGITVFKTVKIAIAKVAFSIIIMRMGLSVLKSLKESMQMGGDSSSNKRHVYRRLFYFCLIPLVLNALLLIPEFFWVGNIITLANAFDDCDETNIFSRHPIVYGLQAGIFTFGTYIYYLAFLVLFRTVRQAFICKKGRSN